MKYKSCRFIYGKIRCVIVERDDFYIGSSYRTEFNIENMKEYDITDKIKDLL